MKKIYVNPKTEIVAVSTIQMIAESIQSNGNYDDGTGITIGSRRGGGWDDDDY